MAKKMYMLHIEMALDNSMVFIYDVSHFHPTVWELKRSLRGANMYEFIGKEVNVYVGDTFGSFTREQALKIATAFVKGETETYSYRD